MEPHARRFDPITSHEAATKVRGLNARQRAVLAVLSRIGPSTDAELVEAYQARTRSGTLFDQYPAQSESGIRTRRVELERKSLVRVVDIVRLPTGRRGRRFEVVFGPLD